MKYNEQDLALLDMFAGQALCGLIANPDTKGLWKVFAKEAYDCAEAMLEERKKFIE
jgi:hypothetical protein